MSHHVHTDTRNDGQNDQSLNLLHQLSCGEIFNNHSVANASERILEIDQYLANIERSLATHFYGLRCRGYKQI